MEPADQQQAVTYDAFISYSRQDKAFAALLEKALESYKPPKDLDVPQRHPNIFRDEQDFTGTEYQRSLEKHLQESAKLIVVCSPAARKSQYVNDEIRGFAKSKGAQHIIPLLIAGIPNNEAKPSQEIEKAFPEALCEELGTPLAADYRGFDVQKDKVYRGVFEGAWYKTLADLYGRSRVEIEQRERKRQIRGRCVSATVASAVLLVIGGTTWLWQKDYTVDQALLKVQSVFVSIHVEPYMVPIPASTFRQGDTRGNVASTEKPVREVAIKPFALGKYEVTFDEYDRFAIATGRPLPGDQYWRRERRPVIHVAWHDAVAYAEWVSKATGKRYRLPTESEWEYAARSGGKDEIWAGTSNQNQLTDYAVYISNSQDRTAPVGEKKPNGLGLYDMTGNVWEWVEDCVHVDYNDAPTDGSAWLEDGGGYCSRRVLRGGSWYEGPVDLRASYRVWITADFRDPTIGFRLAQDIE